MASENKPTVEELEEDVDFFLEMWAEFGAEWGDRLAEASDDLAREKGKA